MSFNSPEGIAMRQKLVQEYRKHEADVALHIAQREKDTIEYLAQLLAMQWQKIFPSREELELLPYELEQFMTLEEFEEKQRIAELGEKYIQLKRDEGFDVNVERSITITQEGILSDIQSISIGQKIS